MASSRLVGCLGAALVFASCGYRTQSSPSVSGHKATGGTGGTSQSARDGGSAGTLPKDAAACVVSRSTVQLSLTNTDKVDLLFLIDNSDSMADKQALLRAQLPHLITVLTTGDADGDGKNDFPPAKDLHLGVVDSDMGLPGVDGILNCMGLGQDGILQHQPSAQVTGCQVAYPPFLAFQAGINQPMQTAQDFACIAQLGTGGCGFEHQLEATLKALWPSVDPMAAVNGGMNRITFLTDPNSGQGRLGHGDTDNVGFVRNDPMTGLSLIAVIVLSDEDDCSSSDTRPFTPPQFLDQNDPLVMEGMTVRCHFNQQALYPVERYINGLKALRPGNENLVVFAAIVGVPPDLTGPDALMQTDFSVAADRDRFYKNILNDPRMAEVINTQGTPDPSDDKLLHSCVLDVNAASQNRGQMGAADPPIRIVKVAAGFGENGIVQSICERDYAPALDAIIKTIAKQLGATCLPRPLARTADGTVACDVVWELPPPGTAPTGTPTECHHAGFEFLLDPAKGAATTSDRGGAVCRVAQLGVEDTGGTQRYVPTLTDGTMFTEGWYYDDFSDEVKKVCTGSGRQRVAFTSNARPAVGVTVKLECSNETHAAVPGTDAGGTSCSAGSASK